MKEAVVGLDVEMEMVMDAGVEVEEGEIVGEGEEPVADMDGYASEREDYCEDERKGAEKQQPCSAQRWEGGGFHHLPCNLQYKLNILNGPGVYGGAIILCNRVTKWESLQKQLFALPEYATSFIRKIRAGMLLFVFEREERILCGVFEATSDGALNIIPSAFPSSRKSRPAQVRFRRVWFCKPLTEVEFSDVVKGIEPSMSFFGISYQQVLNLVDLFSSRRIGLQPYQKPKSRVIWDYNVSLARSGLESTLHTHSNSSSIFCNSGVSLLHSPFMYAKQNVQHAAYNYESSLQPVVFKALDIKENGLELSDDYIPLDLDDCKPDSETVLPNIPGTVSFYSTLVDSINYEDQALKPFGGKCNVDDGFPSPVLNQSFISVSKTSENSAIAQFMKERKAGMVGKGSKRKPVFQIDGDADLSSTSCPVALQRPALSELDQNKEAVTAERKQEVGCLVQDGSAKRSKLMCPGILHC